MNSPQPRLPLTAVVLTRNEADNIAACLEAMAEIDDVVVLDSGSTDATIDNARSARPDVRVFVNPFVDFGAQRNWAIDHCEIRHSWLLFVDADEICDVEFIEELRFFLNNPGSFIGARIAGRNYFLGRWLKYTTMYPSYQVRLLRLGAVRYVRHGHGQKEQGVGEYAVMRHGWRHESFSKGVAGWIARHNVYSTAEVELIGRLKSSPMQWRNLFGWDRPKRRAALKQLSAKLPMRPVFSFVYLYVLRGGFLDGYPGLLYSLLVAAHHIHIMAKVAEYKAGIQGRRG